MPTDITPAASPVLGGIAKKDVIGGGWFTESGITDAEQLEVTAARGVLRLRRREEEGFGI
ncbi:hypothetical protein [Yersinia enterocolitica]|uniref:hypothetical protein n=1 Tax=Yersinia enterocolitica TaxID=630 RepID=UPI003CFC3430